LEVHHFPASKSISGMSGCGDFLSGATVHAQSPFGLRSVVLGAKISASVLSGGGMRGSGVAGGLGGAG
jgi:acyl-CoA hydrolase